MFQATYKSFSFKFNFPGGTSRGVLTEKQSWFLKLWNDKKPNNVGIGEISILPGLSPETPEIIEQYLYSFCQNPESLLAQFDKLQYPAIKFAVETALIDLTYGGRKILFPSEFTEGKKGIQINGLVWMGNKDEMLVRLREKVEQGFKCVKLKIGAINFDEELQLLKYIRETFSENDVEIRVDANGAFSPENALKKIESLAKYKLHSIEQPIKQGQFEQMAKLCQQSAIPIALDEELIGVHEKQYKKQLLEYIAPQYIILKPSLVGGLYETNEWGKLADKLNIGWWVTSALEGNIGLNAIAQWTFMHGSKMPQGLGTGQVFSNNIESPLEIKGQELWHNHSRNWEEIEIPNNDYNDCITSSIANNKQKGNWKNEYLTITINGERHNLNKVIWNNFNKLFTGEWWLHISQFLKEWSNDSESVMLQTSGTTGKPKQIKVEKQKLLVSAAKTCDYFKLTNKSVGLLCLSVNYIAGKMMLIRAMLSGMDLICVEPSNKPLENIFENIDFTAMVPMQVEQCMHNANFKFIRNLIVGGGKVNQSIIDGLKKVNTNAYETFGMTETLSHIALKQLAPNSSEVFKTLEGISISQNYNNELLIDYPELGIYKLKTNDIIEIVSTNGEFKWIGRTDFVINSGGVKISPEAIEKQIFPFIERLFCITGLPDKKLGEMVVLLIEGEPFDTKHLMNEMRKSLPSYYLPKQVKFVHKFPLTNSGKIQRKKIFEPKTYL